MGNKFCYGRKAVLSEGESSLVHGWRCIRWIAVYQRPLVEIYELEHKRHFFECIFVFLKDMFFIIFANNLKA